MLLGTCLFRTREEGATTERRKLTTSTERLEYKDIMFRCVWYRTRTTRRNSAYSSSGTGDAEGVLNCCVTQRDLSYCTWLQHWCVHSSTTATESQRRYMSYLLYCCASGHVTQASRCVAVVLVLRATLDYSFRKEAHGDQSRVSGETSPLEERAGDGVAVVQWAGEK